MCSDEVAMQDEQKKVIRAMTLAQWWKSAERLYWAAREWKAAALRSLHPEWPEETVREAVKESFLHAGN